VVLGAGKAAASTARALETQWRVPLQGQVIVPPGHGLPLRHIQVVEAAHPVPDAAGVAAAEDLLARASALRVQDLLVCPVSGGGSSLMCLPADGLSLEDKQAANRALLRSGASISEINTVRKHLSRIKGGRLAAACPAPVLTLLLSDVPGDDPAVIASGPTVADPTTCQDACRVLDRYGIALPAAVRRQLELGDWESPKPGDPRLSGTTWRWLARPADALAAAADAARRRGVEPILLGDAVEGEARQVAATMAGQARDAIGRPRVLLSGGETTVTVRGAGRGGRNTEFLLALGIALEGAKGIHALACDTDGIDGSGDNAGALLHPDSLARLARLGLEPRTLLNDNDAYRAFAALDDLVVTGPTLTNVNDFRAILLT